MLVDGVHEDLCLQHREECGYALGICKVKCVVTCHDVHHTVRDVFFWEDQHRHGSNGQYAVGFSDNDHRAEENCWGVLQTETQKEKGSRYISLFRDYGQVVEHKKNCVVSYMHTFLTSRM